MFLFTTWNLPNLKSVLRCLSYYLPGPGQGSIYFGQLDNHPGHTFHPQGQYSPYKAQGLSLDLEVGLESIFQQQDCID